MSKICGILNFENEEFIDKEDLNLSFQKLFGSNGLKTSVWTEKNVGLIQTGFNFSGDKANQAGPGLSIVADTSLTNRTELFEKFGVFPSEHTKFTDQQLILKAYEKWGESCPEYLAGDFAFAIWDGPLKKLFCARDHFGASTLFYYKDAEKFVFGSKPTLILNFKDVEKKLNLNKIGIFLIPEPHTYLTDQSWLEGISVLPAGTSLTVDRDGIKPRKYWTPAFTETLPFKTEEEFIEAFRQMLFEIIQARLPIDKPAASLLSGGLDSSSIVSIAAKILEKQNREINVFAGVLGNEQDEQFSDERFFIDQFKSFPNVRINYVSAPGAGPFSDLEEFFENQDSPFLSSRHYLYTAFTKAASAAGADTLLDGVFGELGATAHGYGGFAELFAQFKWLTLWRELKLRKELYNDSIRYNIRANIISPLLPQFLINLRHGKLKNETPLNTYNPIQKDLAESFLKEVDPGEFIRRRVSANHRRSQINDLKLVQKLMGENYSFSFGPEPVEFRYPFLDKRLIEFTTAVPIELKFKNGYYRYLIRVALDKILPPKIQWRTSKTPFSPDYMRRFNSQIEGVRDLLADISANDPLREALDIEKIKNWADLSIPDTERYTENEAIARDHLPQAIYLIYFLRKFSEFRL